MDDREASCSAFGLSGTMDWSVNDDDNHDSSPLDEEANSDGNIVGSGALKKGPWTPEEDAILTDYVDNNGHGNWNAVQKFSGLSRCGKSCRLRWTNHLRPELKKGVFTQEEEDTIIRLHAKLGNKWARMAAKLPGRTDNEIKNFWNTRIKKLQRSGRHIYPDDLLILNKSNKSQQSQVSGTFSNEIHSSQNLMEPGLSGFPPFKIKHSLCSELYSSKQLGFPTDKMLPQDIVPSWGVVYPTPTMRPQKRLQESDASHGLSDTATSCLFTRPNCNAPFQDHPTYELAPLPGSWYGDNSYLHVLHGSHALINGTHSISSSNFGSAKLELPSLQSSDSDYSFWDAPPSPLPSVKYTDTLIQSPQARPSQLQGTSDTDGLLESIVWPQNKVKTSKVETDPTEKTATGDLDDFMVDIDEPDWDIFADPIPTMGSSTTSIFNDFTLFGFSTDELQPTDAMLSQQAKRSEADPSTPPIGIRSLGMNHNGDLYQLDSLRPDAWLNANLLSPNTEQGKDFLVLQEAISALKDDKNHLHSQQQLL